MFPHVVRTRILSLKYTRFAGTTRTISPTENPSKSGLKCKCHKQNDGYEFGTRTIKSENNSTWKNARTGSSFRTASVSRSKLDPLPNPKLQAGLADKIYCI